MADFLQLLPLFQETSDTVRARLNDDLNSGLEPTDIRNTDSREGNFYFDVTQPAVLEFARLWDALGSEVPAAASAATAWGDYLDSHAAVFGLSRKIATAATGTATFTGAPLTPVGTGVQVSPDSASPTDNPPTFQTTNNGVTSAGILAPATISATYRVLAPPTGLAGTPSASGGTLPAGNYFYVVTALNAVGETLASSEIQVITTGTTSSVALSWSARAGATSYRVYRGPATGAEASFYGTTGTTLTDTGAAPSAGSPPLVNTAATDSGNLPPADYDYVVTALTAFGETTASPEVDIILPQTGAIYLTWAAVTGAISYNVYRGTDPGTETLLATLGNVTTLLDDGSYTLGSFAPPDDNNTAGVTLNIQAILPGVAGNVSAGAITQLYTPVTGISAVTNNVPTLGGAEPESDTDLRARVIAQYTGQGAGTVGDYQRWALAYPGVGRADVTPIWNGPGTVLVTAYGADGSPLSTPIVGGLQAQLDPAAYEGTTALSVTLPQAVIPVPSTNGATASGQITLYDQTVTYTGITAAALANPAGPPTLVGSTTGGTLAAGTRYYKISALNASGETLPSSEASVVLTGTTSSVAVSWAAVPGAVNYRIYRGTAAGAENAYYTVGAVTTFTDTGAASTAGTPSATNTTSAAFTGCTGGTGTFVAGTRVAQGGGLGHGLAPIGATVTVTTPTTVLINVDATLILAAGYTIDGTASTVAVRASIVSAIGNYLNSLPSGQLVYRDHILARFFAVDGVLDVVLNTPAANVPITNTPAQIARLGVVTLA